MKVVSKKAVSTILLTSLLGLANSVFAGCNTNSCSGKVTETLITSNFLYLDTDSNENLLGCTPANGRFIKFSKNEASFRDWYASILTAKTMDIALTVGIEAGSNPCKPTYISIGN